MDIPGEPRREEGCIVGDRDVFVPVTVCLRMHFHAPVLTIHNLRLRHAGARIQRCFNLAIVVVSAVRDFNYQECILEIRNLAKSGNQARQNQIRLWLGSAIEPEWILHMHKLRRIALSCKGH